MPPPIEQTQLILKHSETSPNKVLCQDQIKPDSRISERSTPKTPHRSLKHNTSLTPAQNTHKISRDDRQEIVVPISEMQIYQSNAPNTNNLRR